MARRKLASAIVFLLVLAGIGGTIFVLLSVLNPAGGITVTTQGSPIVGASLRFLLTVRIPGPSTSAATYLSLEGINGTFEATPSGTSDLPWGRPSIWNLTGLDLGRGRTFLLDTTPIWAGEIRLQAFVWTTPGGYGAVRFVAPDSVDASTVGILYATRISVTTQWPLSAAVSPDGPLVLGQPANLTVSVRQSVDPWQAPTLLYLSLVAKAPYFAALDPSTSGNPWGTRTVWNATGEDLSRGIQVVVPVMPTLAGSGIPVDVVVWSPRGALSAVGVASDGSVLTPEAVRLWADVTVSFPVSSA